MLGAAALCAGCGGAHPAATTTTSAGGVLGLVPAGPHRKPAIVLTDTAGRRYDLTTATRGKLVYLYFGYTHCPDACPLTMATLAAALRDAPQAERSRVAVVFVTVDPRRDTKAVLRRWLDRYSDAFIGLTGTPAQIRTAERQADVPLASADPGSTSGYTVSHASLVLTYSPDGRTHAVYPDGFSARDYVHDLPLLLAAGRG